MEVTIRLDSSEIKLAVNRYIGTLGMNLDVKEVTFDDKGNAVARCEKAKSPGGMSYLDR